MLANQGHKHSVDFVHPVIRLATGANEQQR
jgi:hypothetical protein